MDSNVKAILMELCRIENRDLLKAVIELGSGSEEQSFIAGFTQNEPLNFDSFVQITNQINFELNPQLGLEPELYIDMSSAYDEYLKQTQDHNAKVSLDTNATARFEAIIDKYDMDGWSGGYYAFVMRQVQAHAKLLNSN